MDSSTSRVRIIRKRAFSQRMVALVSISEGSTPGPVAEITLQMFSGKPVFEYRNASVCQGDVCRCMDGYIGDGISCVIGMDSGPSRSFGSRLALYCCIVRF